MSQFALAEVWWWCFYNVFSPLTFDDVVCIREQFDAEELVQDGSSLICS